MQFFIIYVAILVYRAIYLRNVYEIDKKDV